MSRRIPRGAEGEPPIRSSKLHYYFVLKKIVSGPVNSLKRMSRTVGLRNENFETTLLCLRKELAGPLPRFERCPAELLHRNFCCRNYQNPGDGGSAYP